MRTILLAAPALVLAVVAAGFAGPPVAAAGFVPPPVAAAGPTASPVAAAGLAAPPVAAAGLAASPVRDATVVGDGGWARAGGPALESGRLGPAGFAVKGIDVSGHDHATHPIDWAAVAASGVSFAYVKATEGTTFVNPYYSTDYQAARDNGLRVGAYAFGRPDLGNPVGQADHLVDQSLWTVDSQTLIPFLDVEWPYGSIPLNACWGLTPVQMTAWIHGFLDRVRERIGRLPMIYTNTNWWNPCTGRDPSFGDYPLDLAGYTSAPPPLPAGWRNFTLWQYGAGLSTAVGNYDKDVYNGDLPGLATLAAANPPQVLSLRAHANGKFVSADNAGRSALIANRGVVGTWEQFDQIDLGGGDVALRSHANGRYVTADSAGTAPLIANRMSAGTWERFRLVHNPDGSVSLWAEINGRYVTAETRGAAPLIANRRSIGVWEEFDASLT